MIAGAGIVSIAVHTSDCTQLTDFHFQADSRMTRLDSVGHRSTNQWLDYYIHLDSRVKWLITLLSDLCLLLLFWSFSLLEAKNPPFSCWNMWVWHDLKSLLSSCHLLQSRHGGAFLLSVTSQKVNSQVKCPGGLGGLHVLPGSVWILSGSSGFLPPSKNMRLGDKKGDRCPLIPSTSEQAVGPSPEQFWFYCWEMQCRQFVGGLMYCMTLSAFI